MYKPIFLIGFPGCGKTTLCNALKSKLGDTFQFVDIDEFIVSFIGMSVSDFFARNGEAAFRKLETECIQVFSKKWDTIIACGGGTPCFGVNMKIMNEAGQTVWLQASEERLFQRLSAGRSQRPLIAKKTDEQLKQYISETLKSRTEYYSQAQYKFSTENLENEDEIDATAEKFIIKFGLSMF